MAILFIPLLYCSLTSFKTLDFILIEAKTNELIRNKEIEVYYYQMRFDAPPILDFIKKVKTNDSGQFSLPKKIFGEKEIGIKCGEEFQIINFGICDNKICLFRYRNGDSQVLSKTFYDLQNGIETNYIYHSHSIETKFTGIKLFAYDSEMYWTKLKNEVLKNQNKFENSQQFMWDYLWSEFEQFVDCQTAPPFNIGAWFSHIVTCTRIFDLDIESAFEYAKEIKEDDKRYYFLYSLCFLANGMSEKGQQFDNRIVTWIEKEVDEFYDKRVDLDLNQTNGNLPQDYLASAYKVMKEKIEK